jgi:hypothetical protein
MRGALVGAFGLACGKLSMKNKPVLTYVRPPRRSHIEILGDKGIFYKGPRDLKQILLAYTPDIQHSMSWDTYFASAVQSQSCSSLSRYSWSRAWVIR